MSSHTAAVLQALFVTFLWSTSWVLIRVGLEDIPALTFAGLRYTIAFLCLLPLVLRRGELKPVRQLSRRRWRQLITLGLLFYAVTQGAMFVSLFYLPAVSVSLLLSFSPVVVALLAIGFLNERPSLGQWIGTAIFLLGVVIYFLPADFGGGEVIGLVVAVTGVLANALSSILGRDVNRRRDLSPLAVTVVTMGIGGMALLVASIAVEGLPSLSLNNWAIVLWLAVVNSALAFTLWNHTLRTLSAMESSVINNTMLIQIAILAWLFLDETLSGRQIVGLILAAVGALVVQLRGQNATRGD
ncbi:MAG: EamA family transporter [Chloroflexota bacterium]|nr:MAG: EamA family transporter [Chloroflexota bacterium]